MSLASIPFIFSAGQTIIASQHNSNFSTIYNVVNGGLDNSNIAAGAGIVYTKLYLAGQLVNTDISPTANIDPNKLATINIAGKVDGAALTDFAAIPSGAGNIPLANLGNVPQVLFVPNNIQVFNSSGTWTKPAGVSNVYVKVIGAGGNGGSRSGDNSQGGGGGGGYAEGIIAVTGNVTVTIGSTNSFAGSSTIQATSGSSNSASSGGAGGVGSGGTINLTGTAGQDSNGSTGVNSPGGNGGSSAMGAGGAGGPGIDGNPISAKNGGQYGGGGGGVGASFVGSGGGGSGDAGAVIVYY